MTDMHHLISALRRPGLLVRTARIGLADYRRTPALRRMFVAAGARTQAQIVATLIEKEAELDACRRDGNAAYSPARHVEVLTALMAEAGQLPVRTGPILVPLPAAASAAPGVRVLPGAGPCAAPIDRRTPAEMRVA